MKLLIVEDNETVLDAIRSVLSADGVQITQADDIDRAVDEANSGKYDAIILDSAVGDRKGLSLLDRVSVSDQEKRPLFARRPKDPAILVIRHAGDVIPTDNPLLKGEIMFPFTSERLKEGLGNVLSYDMAVDLGLVIGPGGKKSADDLSQIGITEGKAYLFYEQKPKAISSIVGMSANAGFHIFLVTASRPKVAKERMGLDRETEVFLLEGNELPMGSMVAAVSDYVEKHERSMVVIDDLDVIFDRCGIDRTLRALSLILKGKNAGKFTFMTSVDASAHSESIKGLLGQLMNVYNTEEYYGKD